ncbi:MAG: glycosyltransferase family 39 protein [Anaerolineae bacterium]|nr:glycosyltransferase family 39 protein [Anaerolineae bacterium]
MNAYHWLRHHPIWLVLGLALAVRIVPATVRFVIGSDDGLFLTLGQNLVAGQGYTGDGVTTQIDFPPGYPFFAAGVYLLGGGPELPTKLNILLIGMLLPLTIYWLTYQLADKSTALIAGLLTALHPALVLAQGNFESVAEQPYAVLLYTGWALLWWALRNRRLWAFGLAGILIGMAHLVRWEGVVLGLIAAGIIVVALRRAAILPVLTFLVGLALFALPYGLFLYRHTGSVLSPKTMLTQLHAAAIDATVTDPYAFERSFFEHYEAWLADPHHPPQVVAESRVAAPRRYVGNAVYQVRLWFTSLSLMTLLWIIPFFIGLATLGFKETLFLLPLFIPLAAIPASVVDPRYFLVPLPVMMVFAAQGWTWLGRRLPSLRLPGQARSVSLATLLLATTLTLFALAGLSGPFLYPRPTGYRTAGFALRDQIASGAHILARKRQIPFYAGGVWEWLPFADLDGVLAYAATHNAEYLVVDKFTTPALRPQLAYLLDPTNAPDHLEPVYVDDAAGIVIYRISR